ncbi:MAG: Rpn family recombination-promoting nuclease/putative transposase, partial [Bdellovibrionales bacterium]|nr:Rpn family recombination-promoting nuclease/putative transposase [Bdellovibrionales bacterium]
RKKPKLTHDSFFKLFYSDTELAKELLKLIFSKKEVGAYDLNKVKIEKDTFEEKRADLIFSLPFKKYPKSRVKIFILLEHKSFYDKNLFSQLLDYQVLGRKQSIQQVGYPQPIITVLFYHGKEPLKWKKSLQEEDFGLYFSKIPIESRKDMLNYGLRIINTQDPRIRQAVKGGKFKGYSVIKLLSEIWSLKKKVTPLKVTDAYAEFEEILKDLKGKERRTVELRILEYLRDNTELDSKIWEKAEKLLIEAGVLKQGGLMQDVREIIKEKGRWEGEREGLKKGRQEGRQEVVLNMLKEKADITFISKVTGLSEKAIKKLKNGS